MRLFLAIELNDAARRHLADLSRHWQDNWAALLAAGVRKPPRCAWVCPQNLHVTLKFLGQLENARVPEICSILQQTITPVPLHLQADKLELLPPRGPVRVIAAGLGGDIAALAELHRSIESTCEHIGFPPEARKYRPHVTLSRARIPLHGTAHPILEESAKAHLPGPPMTAGEFVLMESRLHRDAAEYIPIARFPL